MIAVMKKRATLTDGASDVADLTLNGVRDAYNAERAWWNEIKPEMHDVINTHVAGPVRDIPIRIYKPNDLDEGPTLLYLHGGGWILGNLETHDRVMRLLADFSGARVVGVDYALSPEYKFPVAINEVRAVLDWLQAHGPDHGLDSARLGIGGDSAGANLAVSVTQLCHQQESWTDSVPTPLLRRVRPNRVSILAAVRQRGVRIYPRGKRVLSDELPGRRPRQK